MINRIRSKLQLCLYPYLFKEYTADLKNDATLNIINDLYKYKEISNISVDITDVTVDNVLQFTVNVTFTVKKNNKVHKIVISTNSMN